MMGIILKLISNPVLRAIVSQLLSWLLSECAAFVARYINDAVPIVENIAKAKDADGNPISGGEKFARARDELAAKLKEEGIEYRDHFVDTAIQAAVGVVKSKLEKK